LFEIETRVEQNVVTMTGIRWQRNGVTGDTLIRFPEPQELRGHKRMYTAEL